jgi:hypothetical protein
MDSVPLSRGRNMKSQTDQCKPTSQNKSVSIMTASDLQIEEESVSEILCISDISDSTQHQTYVRFDALTLVIMKRTYAL